MPMTPKESAEAIDRNFRKRVRFVVENSEGKFSDVWLFWGNRDDFYFGARTVSDAIKVSLHKNGVGYVAFDKRYHAAKANLLSRRTIREWKLPQPKATGAVHVASVILPADYCAASVAPPGVNVLKVLVLGVEPGAAAEIGMFMHLEHPQSIEPRLTKIGKPIFVTTLDNGAQVSIVVRSQPFDRSLLPQGMKIPRLSFNLSSRSKEELLGEAHSAIICSAPPDNGTLQVISVGGVRLRE